MTSIFNQAGPYATIPEWHLRRLLAHPAGRRSVVLRTYLRIAVEVSGRRTRDGWYIEGGIRGLAAELGADVRDVRSAVAVLHELGLVLRQHRRTQGDRGHYLASAYVLTVVEPVGNPGDGVDRGGGFPPHHGGGDCPPHPEGGKTPPTSGGRSEEGEEDDPPRRSPDCGEPPQEAPGTVPGPVVEPDARGPWLSGDEATRVILAGHDLDVLACTSDLAERAARWVTTRIDALVKLDAPTADLCWTCGHASDARTSTQASQGRCEACGARSQVWHRREAIDASGRVLGHVLRPFPVLRSARGMARQDVDRIDAVAERAGLWSSSLT